MKLNNIFLFFKVSFLQVSLVFLVGVAPAFSQSVHVDPLSTLPPVVECVNMTLQAHSNPGKLEKSKAIDLEHRVRLAYEMILVRKEQIGISREVQGHFEKAVTNAERKFEEGEGDVTQGALTKLKLGLAGTLNDITQFESDISLARLDLEALMGVRIHPEFKLADDSLSPRKFPFTTIREYGEMAEGGNNPFEKISAERRIALEKSMVRVNQARSQFDLARKNRRMTRALLVTEVANYDFGIGDEKDLFETLIIYTRVLVGFYDALHNFNEAVAEFEKEVFSTNR